MFCRHREIVGVKTCAPSKRCFFTLNTSNQIRNLVFTMFQHLIVQYFKRIFVKEVLEVLRNRHQNPRALVISITVILSHSRTIHYQVCPHISTNPYSGATLNGRQFLRLINTVSSCNIPRSGATFTQIEHLSRIE